jgi:type II secretory pathway component GspD/PulD (secretin)
MNHLLKTNEIDTKLLISDGDIVVIGGIKIDRASNHFKQPPQV